MSRKLAMIRHGFSFTTQELDSHVLRQVCRFCGARIGLPCRQKPRTARFAVVVNHFHMDRLKDGHNAMEAAHAEVQQP